MCEFIKTNSRLNSIQSVQFKGIIQIPTFEKRGRNDVGMHSKGEAEKYWKGEENRLIKSLWLSLVCKLPEPRSQITCDVLKS